MHSDAQTVESQLDDQELTHCINTFLVTLPTVERNVFVSRYWFLASVKEIADCFGFTESKVKSMLFRTRNQLRTVLQKEGLI